MPGSRPNCIPTVIHLLRQLKPESILDVGVGFGKWGHLFREYTDIIEAEQEPARYQKAHWRVRIDGIEAHSPYLTPMHEYLYDTIHLGDAASLIKTVPAYDLIFLGDIIEHFDKSTGVELLRESVSRARKAVIVVTPKYDTAQEALCGNEFERHRSLWRPTDFRSFTGAQLKTVDGDTLLAVLPRPGLAPLVFKRRPPKVRERQLLEQARREVGEIVSGRKQCILVDEEQLRPRFTGRQLLPFLEKDGVYFGPPPDGRTAIRELERLRAAGAEAIVFISSTFWWLEHYPDFHSYLERTYSCFRKADSVIAFDLQRPANPACSEAPASLKLES